MRWWQTRPVTERPAGIKHGVRFDAPALKAELLADVIHTKRNGGADFLKVIAGPQANLVLGSPESDTGVTELADTGYGTIEIRYVTGGQVDNKPFGQHLHRLRQIVFKFMEGDAYDIDYEDYHWRHTGEPEAGWQDNQHSVVPDAQVSGDCS